VVADTDAVVAALRDVVDPEVGINVVDLGLVYEVRRSDGAVHVVMTMTSAACPLGASLAEAARASIRARVAGVQSVTVDVVSEPAWEPSRMSDAARRQLGWT